MEYNHLISWGGGEVLNDLDNQHKPKDHNIDQLLGATTPKATQQGKR